MNAPAFRGAIKPAPCRRRNFRTGLAFYLRATSCRLKSISEANQVATFVLACAFVALMLVAGHSYTEHWSARSRLILPSYVASLPL